MNEIFSNVFEAIVLFAVLNILIDFMFGINIADIIKRLIDKLIK